jgi:GntR family transcriptional regulator/MocR family aminotransferase
MALVILSTGGETLQNQIYSQLRDQILSGALSGGSPLPSSRSLAAELSLSRNTINAVYARLEGEGYIRIIPSSGILVTEGIGGLRPDTRAAASFKPPREISLTGSLERRRDLIDFRSGIPDLTRFPVARWSRMTRQVLDQATPDSFGYGQPEGRRELREAVCAYAVRYRGVKAEPDQVLVTAGTTQAVSLLTRILLVPEGPDGPRGTAVVEEPLTADIKRIIRGLGGRVVPVPVDSEGFDPVAIPAGTDPAAVYVTPSHQFPLGMVMSLRRRLALTEYARRWGVWIIEDDYDSEFRHSGPPLPSLQGLAPDRTIYVGTFSKTLSPALRTGYLILPPGLVEQGRRLKWFSDLHNPVIDQLVLARFVGEGYYGRHLSALKRIYGRNREVLVSELTSASIRCGLKPEPEILGEAAGLHLSVRFPGMRFDGERLSRLEAAGVKVYPVSEHAEHPERWQDTVILGFGSLDRNDLAAGARIIAETVTNVTDRDSSQGVLFPSGGAIT